MFIIMTNSWSWQDGSFNLRWRRGERGSFLFDFALLCFASLILQRSIPFSDVCEPKIWAASFSFWSSMFHFLKNQHSPLCYCLNNKKEREREREKRETENVISTSSLKVLLLLRACMFKHTRMITKEIMKECTKQLIIVIVISIIFV